ncbi:hypothetical protein [Stackebrandtia nassauensis]|uniref:Uncharacterized protein n=1 Tax=Stackebrandtia nassauensis (strain DSM 44728 / CIP 108903 / NRRL B-16338 / NBRC 102104 / LLR-40K-21) TaxID=446470 RepID=D3Q385_STANL|nr:hypothetical protein [Stackebrandtia nassauensis]ADD40055.1 hypothetical protein Snas_0337 [Stackebrandtia nassauensis DSM 44728]
MTTTDRRTWSPYAPRPEDPDYDATSASPKPIEVAVPASVEPKPVAAPTVAVAETAESPTSTSGPESTAEGNSALRTPHSENTPRDSKQQVDDGDGVPETPHSAPKSAPATTGTEPAATGPEAAQADDEPGFTESAKASAASIGQRLKPLLLGLRPPAIWTQPPASLKALVLYADQAPWADKTGPIRASGRVWNRVIAVPLCTVLYYAAWLVQRPSRFVVLLVLYVLLAHTSLGGWLPWLW